MNFLSPDDIFSGVRRKSLCNGSLLHLSGKNSGNGDGSTTPNKSKKERRRGSFNEPLSNSNSSSSNGGGTVRRASLVSRWFKHISDAAEQYKPRSKNANHEPVDDPAIATLPHSNTKESLELTPERPPPMAATATVTTTPLAPMMPIATATTVHPHGNNNMNNNNNNYENILRNGRRESTPIADNGAYHRQRLSHNELSPAMSAASSASSVNRTMSTRSCGETNNNSAFGPEGASANGVTLRHTQSARQANGSNASDEQQVSAGLAGGWKRDSASIVYSNNSNNTRTLMQSSPPLVEPTAIQISISPAHTAEPVLTPAERLRRLDVAIRDGLLEKQKIICDMFRLPVEHFHEIVDIAAMPEAPKDSADIALAAYAQVQSLTEVLNDYMHVTSEQEISAVSTAVCDQCHEKQQHRHQRPVTPGAINSPTSSASASSTVTQIATSAAASDTPPPLPPPNKQPSSGGHQQAQQQTPTPTNVRTVLQNAVMDEMVDIHEDDDGYCEIDELRLPALPAAMTAAATGKTTKTETPPPLPPPAGTFKVPPPPPPHTNTGATTTTTPATTPATEQVAATTSTNAGVTPELVKRQSTISADSIPEESADEVSKALSEGLPETKKTKEEEKVKETEESTEDKKEEEETKAEEAASTEAKTGEEDQEDTSTLKAEKEKNEKQQNESTATQELNKELVKEIEKESNEDDKREETEEVSKPEKSAAINTEENTEPEDKAETKEDDEQESADQSFGDDSTGAEAEIDIADAYNALSTLNAKLNSALARVDNSTQTLPMPMALALYAASAANANSEALLKVSQQHTNIQCGPNRIQHANSLEPSIPCYALNSIVSALNAQISLLLPKISERDMERERLRKENQHLRELLNAMHERQRVGAKLETPSEPSQALNRDDSSLNLDETDGGNISTISNSNSDTTLTALTVSNDESTLLAVGAGSSEASKESV